MDHHNENAAPAKGGEFGVHDKAWQLAEYQTHTIDATDTNLAPWQSIGESPLQDVVIYFIARHRLNSAVGNTMFEQAGLGRRVAQ